MAPERSIAVLGAGAVGGFLGGKLAAIPRQAITLIGRPPVVQAIQTNGARIEEFGKTLITHPAAATSMADSPPQDLVLLAVRTYDVAGVIPDVKRMLADTGAVLALQNGVGTDEVLADALGRERVLVGTLTVSAGMESPGRVVRYSRNGGMALATMTGAPVPGWLVELFKAIQLPTVTVDDYRSLRWSKLLLNMLGAATTAILDMDMRDVICDPELFRVEQLGFREAGRMMEAQHIGTVSLPGYPVPLAQLAMRLPRELAQLLLGERLAAARGGHSPTMRADLQRGRSEIGWLHGAVSDTARRLGRRAPVCAALADIVARIVEDPRYHERYRGNPAALLGELQARGVRI
jgi:2-dehydropantoate 2-reductase